MLAIFKVDEEVASTQRSVRYRSSGIVLFRAQWYSQILGRARARGGQMLKYGQKRRVWDYALGDNPKSNERCLFNATVIPRLIIHIILLYSAVLP